MFLTKRLFGSLAVITLSFLSSQGVEADIRLKPLTAEEMFIDPSEGFIRTYNEALQGNCDPFKEYISELRTTDNRRISAELYDRGICFQHNPSKAFELFQEAVENNDIDYYANIAWKYFNGHGVQKSEELGNQAFAKFLSKKAAFISLDRHLFLERTLRDRNIHPLMKRGFEWLNQNLSTDDKKISFALSLVNGTTVYFDGFELPIDHIASDYILSRLGKKNPKARYHLAVGQLQGKYGEKNLTIGQVHLLFAALCGYEQAVIDNIDFRINEKYGMSNIPFHTYGWYLYALEKGYEGVKRYREHFQPPSYGMLSSGPEYFRTLKIQERQCE